MRFEGLTTKKNFFGINSNSYTKCFQFGFKSNFAITEKMEDGNLPNCLHELLGRSGLQQSIIIFEFFNLISIFSEITTAHWTSTCSAKFERENKRHNML